MPDTHKAPSYEPVKIGIVSISDRASSGTYEDKGLPALHDWLKRALHNPIAFEPRLDSRRERSGYAHSSLRIPYAVSQVILPFPYQKSTGYPFRSILQYTAYVLLLSAKT